MQWLAVFVRGAESVNDWVGRAVSWLVLGAVLACFAAVYLRYALNTNYAWLQESYVWQHAMVIVLGAGFTMMKGGFVRVDIFYGKMTLRRRALVDLFGTLLLLAPFLFVLWTAFFPFVQRAWAVDEGSPNSGGLPNWWFLQGTLLVMILLVALQGIVLIARSLLVLGGREEFAPSSSAL